MLDELSEMEGWRKALLVAMFGILLALGGCVLDNMQASDVAGQFQTLTEKAKSAEARLGKAQEVVSSRRRDYPSKYSAGFDDQLATVRKRLGSGGEVDNLLKDVSRAQGDHRWSVAYGRIGEVNSKLKEDTSVIDRILGPPGTTEQGWYDALDTKSKVVDEGLLGKIEQEIKTAKEAIENLPRKILCDGAGVLKHNRAFAKINEAQGQLGVANRTFGERVEGKVDKPLVYDQAVAARETVKTAVAYGNEDVAAVDTAKSAISAGQSAIDFAQGYIAASSFQQRQAYAALETARSTLRDAVNACNSEILGEAIRLARLAQTQAETARGVAATPTPTPPPTRTPEPRRDSGDTTIIIIGGDSQPSGSKPSGGYQPSQPSSKPPSGGYTPPKSDSGGYKPSTSPSRNDGGGYKPSSSPSRNDGGGYKPSGGSKPSGGKK